MTDLLRNVKEAHHALKNAERMARAEFEEYLYEKTWAEREAFDKALIEAVETRDDFGKPLVTKREIHLKALGTKATRELYEHLTRLGLKH